MPGRPGVAQGDVQRATGGRRIRPHPPRSPPRLRPGGKLTVHGLAADRALTGPPPSLPGPAAAVGHVPTQAEVLAAVEAAGFQNITLTKFSPAPVFQHGGVPLRELMIEATRRDTSPFDLRQQVAYKGPLREVSDDAGNVYRRGQRVVVGGAAAELLRDGPAAASFVFFPPEGTIDAL